jgi:hypothetical protein
MSDHQDEKPFDASEPKDVQKRIKTIKQKEALNKEALRVIMSSQGGRSWILSLLERCHPYTTPFNSDAILMAHNCGEANIGLQVVAELHAVSPELYLLMMKESQDG